jgi:hypothetical protein
MAFLGCHFFGMFPDRVVQAVGGFRNSLRQFRDSLYYLQLTPPTSRRASRGSSHFATISAANSCALRKDGGRQFHLDREQAETVRDGTATQR